MGMKKEPLKRGPGRPATGKSPQRIFRMDDDAWELVEKAAKSVQQTTSAFVRETLLKAAKRLVKV
jgi:uncharacterized protein (DUF1778 family)